MGRALQPYKILFPLETAARELFYKLVLSRRFAELGYECFVGSKSEIGKLVDIVKPFAYFDKGYHEGVSEAIYEKIKRSGGVVISLDEEGGVDFKDSSTILSRYPTTLFEICDLIFLWGTSQFNLLKQNGRTLNDGKVVVSGHPRFELLKPQFQALYQPEIDAIKSRFPRFILFNTNMGFGNNIWGDAFARENYGSRIREIDKVIESDKVKLNAYISLIRRLAPLTGKSIILRPHPEENTEVYTEAFRGLPHVQVLFEGHVIPWLLAADIMIHPDCTTGIECYMLGRTPISYLRGDNIISTFLPVHVSHRCQDEDELIELILSEQYPGLIEETDTLLNEYFSFKKDSTDIIVQSVHQLINGRPYGEEQGLSAYHQAKIAAKELIRPYYYKLIHRDIKLYQNKLSGLNPDSVCRSFSMTCPKPGNGRSVEVRAISPQLFSISCKEHRDDR